MQASVSAVSLLAGRGGERITGVCLSLGQRAELPRRPPAGAGYGWRPGTTCSAGSDQQPLAAGRQPAGTLRKTVEGGLGRCRGCAALRGPAGAPATEGQRQQGAGGGCTARLPLLLRISRHCCCYWGCCWCYHASSALASRSSSSLNRCTSALTSGGEEAGSGGTQAWGSNQSWGVGGAHHISQRAHQITQHALPIMYK